ARREPSQLRDLLPQVLTRVARECGAAGALEPVWKEAVGATIARHSSPVALTGTTLVVRVTDRVWAAELEKTSEQILARLVGLLGGREVTRLVFHEAQR
ncbi:MAG: DUF721 domain-containing protein, partial [Myxococcota bacterium]